MQQVKRFKIFKRYFYIIAGLIILVVLGYKIIVNKSSSKAVEPKAIETQGNQIVTLNREFEFSIPAINDGGQFIAKKEGKIKFKLNEAELKKDIKVKGESRQASEGQIYLILRIELQNDTPDRLAIISSKYVRLIGLENKKFSPDFHNAMVAVDPLSVRRDIVAFIVNKDSKNFTFQVGELEGEKQSIEVAF